MRTFKTLIFTTVIALLGLISAPVTAQQSAAYSQAELDQMLAPIALYPDTVLSHVLIASTYPLEVVQAARWTRNNPDYSGQDAVAMVEDQDWDPSVKALVAFPELLNRMDQDIGWTQGLGDAFLGQEGEVTDTIQYLRNQAYDNGQLQSNAQVNVVHETRYIYIEPAQPQVVYVPYYDPRVVYGPWRWAAYPPVYWHHPPGFSLSLGFYWGTGYHVQSSFFFSSFYWPSRHVVVVDHHYHNHYRNYGHGKGHGGYRPGHHMAHYDGARRWQHSPQHRRGVSYRGDVSQDRFSKRQDSRSRDHSAPVRTAQVRGMQRDWADQQRTRFVDSADRPLRGDRSRDQSGADRAGGENRSTNRDRSIAQVETRVDTRANTRANTRVNTRANTRANTGANTRIDTLANNTARDGRQRSGASNSGRRPAPLDAARDNGRAPTERTAGRVSKELADSGQSRRSNPQPDTPRSTPRTKQAESNRSVLPETYYAAAAPQRSQTPVAAPRQAQAQPQPQRQAPPPREAAPAQLAGVERASKPERAAPSQRSEPRQAAGKSERSNQSHGSRARERNSRD